MNKNKPELTTTGNIETLHVTPIIQDSFKINISPLSIRNPNITIKCFEVVESDCESSYPIARYTNKEDAEKHLNDIVFNWCSRDTVFSWYIDENTIEIKQRYTPIPTKYGELDGYERLQECVK